MISIHMKLSGSIPNLSGLWISVYKKLAIQNGVLQCLSSIFVMGKEEDVHLPEMIMAIDLTWNHKLDESFRAEQSSSTLTK